MASKNVNFNTNTKKLVFDRKITKPSPWMIK